MAGKRKKTKKDTCGDCPAICCKHVALEIDEPDTPSEFDDIRWYLAHRGVYVFVEDGDWYVGFKARCNMLGGKNDCKMYETRPNICRNYSTHNCEFTGDGSPYDLYFNNPDEIEEYAEQFFAKKRAKVKKKKSKKGSKKK